MRDNLNRKTRATRIGANVAIRQRGFDIATVNRDKFETVAPTEADALLAREFATSFGRTACLACPYADRRIAGAAWSPRFLARPSTPIAALPRSGFIQYILCDLPAATWHGKVNLTRAGHKES